MKEDLMNFDLPVNNSSIIKVLGVGGGGSNAVNHMCRQGIRDVDFIVCNTDSQALSNSPVSVKIQIGESLTEGRGAGNKPETGRQAAIENLDDVMNSLGDNTKMVFITAGMGGGTGTGASPVIAKAAKEKGLLTVAIVTLPFRFEGRKRIEQAITGLDEIAQYVDSLLVINNEKLREIYGNLKLSEAFSKADNVLTAAAKGIAEIITVPGYVNVDFADVQTVMANSGVAIMGSAVAEGEGRAITAVEEAINSPLLNNNDITGADNILLNITSGGNEVSMDEITEVTDYISDAVNKDALIIWGTGKDESLGDHINVTVIATGFEANIIPELYVKKMKEKQKVSLEDQKNINTDNQMVEKEVFSVNNDVDTTFEVKQKSIDFDYNEISADEEEIEIEESGKGKDGKKFKAAGKTERQKQLTRLNDKNIEELETQPAYRRKKIIIEKSKYSSNNTVSRYSLFEDEDKNIKLNDNNSFLHDNVD